MAPERRENDKSLWQAIDRLTNSLDVTNILVAQIKTSLVGLPGSNTGVCNQIKNLQENKADKKELNQHMEDHSNNKGDLKWIITIAVTVIIFVLSRYVK
jgi:hypothetical protein